MSKTGEITQKNDYVCVLMKNFASNGTESYLKKRKWCKSKFKMTKQKKTIYTRAQPERQKKREKRTLRKKRSILRSRIYVLLIKAKTFFEQAKKFV